MHYLAVGMVGVKVKQYLAANQKVASDMMALGFYFYLEWSFGS